MSPAPDPNVEAFEIYLNSKKVRPGTRAIYRRAFRLFLVFCYAQGIDPLNPTAGDILRFQDDAEQQGVAAASVHLKTSVLRQFFDWQVRIGQATSNPARSISSPRPPVFARPGLDVRQMRLLWQATKTAHDRVMVGLLMINGLTSEELGTARVTDLSTVDGRPVLNLRRTRTPSWLLKYTVLPPAVNAAIRELIGDRHDGYMLLSPQKKKGPMARQLIPRHVQRIAANAGLVGHITPKMLTFSSRLAAINNHFGYLTVVRSYGAVNIRRPDDSKEVVPDAVHAALRMERLVLGDPNSVEYALQQAEVSLIESDLPPAVSAALAGAALERHLRAYARQNGVTIEGGEERAKLTSYSSALRARKLFNKGDVQVVAAIADHRDNAAHGWFELVSSKDAAWTIREAKRIAQHRPLRPESDVPSGDPEPDAARLSATPDPGPDTARPIADAAPPETLTARTPGRPRRRRRR